MVRGLRRCARRQSAVRHDDARLVIDSPRHAEPRTIGWGSVTKLERKVDELSREAAWLRGGKVGVILGSLAGLTGAVVLASMTAGPDLEGGLVFLNLAVPGALLGSVVGGSIGMIIGAGNRGVYETIPLRGEGERSTAFSSPHAR